MMVHIVIDDRPLCGFTADPPARWPFEHRAVQPEEAHYCSCYGCISRMHERDEMECREVRLMNGVVP